MKTINKILILLLLLSFIDKNIVYSNEDNFLQTIENRLKDFYKKYPNQKTYVCIDKNDYKVGENIWFKAYLLNASNHMADETNANLYVELEIS